MADASLVQYIREQIAAGHSESAVRTQLLASGWQPKVVRAALAAVRKAKTPGRATAPKPRRGSRSKAVRRTRRRWTRAIVALIVLGAGGLILRHVHSGQTPIPNRPIQLTAQQRQANDIGTIAGAVGQYAAANGVLPARSAVLDGGLVLCDAVCSPQTAQVLILHMYEPSKVRIVPYSAQLTAPSTEVIYLVPRAKCEGGTVGDVNANPRSMILLYVVAASSGPTPRCMVL